MAQFCPECGTEIKAGEKFCKACGKKIGAAPSNVDLNTSGGRYEEDHDVADMIFKTTGRLNRLRYLKRCLAVAAVEAIILSTVFILFSNDWGELSTFGSIVALILLIIGQAPYYCLNVRRLHDLDKDETLAYVFVALGIIGAFSSADIFEMSFFEKVAYVVEVIFGVYLLFFPGTHGENKYGADPLG